MKLLKIHLTLLCFFLLASCSHLGGKDISVRGIVKTKPSILENNIETVPLRNLESRKVIKPFGIYITPEDSPVNPERFRGYHTGTDYEILDSEVDEDVPVFTICSGEVLESRIVSGYGGVIIQACTLDDQDVTVLYGHLDIESITYSKGDSLKKGDEIGVLGEGYTEETDGERPHLHLAIHKGGKIEYKGYVQNESELDNWLDFEKISFEEEEIEEVPNDVQAPELSVENLIQKKHRGYDFTVGNILADNQYYTRYYITYMSGKFKISGIMNVPKGEGPFPVLVLNHGHIPTDIYTNGRGLKREQDYFARNGFAVVHIDYRNHAYSDKDTRNEITVRFGYAEDAINVVLAIRNSGLEYLDGDRIGMVGHSMGGGVTLNALVVIPDLIDAAILYAPVTGKLEDSYNRWMKDRISDELIENLRGEMSLGEFWENLNAENYYDRIEAPVLLFHGDEDGSVPIDWAVRTEKSLLDSGVDIEFVRYSDGKHEFISNFTDFMEKSVEFFRGEL